MSALAAIRGTIAGSPFLRYFGVECREANDHRLLLALPCRPEFFGHPDGVVFSPSAILALVEAAGSLAAFLVPSKERPFRLLDFRMEHLAATQPREVLAEVMIVRRDAAGVILRGVVYHDTPDRPVVSFAGSLAGADV